MMMIHLATLGNLFGPDMLVVFLLVLLLFGAKKLPELARGLGQSLNEFRKAREDFEHELHQPAPPTTPPREAQNRQPYGSTLPAATTEQELRRQLQEAQDALRAVQQQKAAPQLMEPSSSIVVESHESAVGTNQPL